jgi:hypothetical protein
MFGCDDPFRQVEGGGRAWGRRHRHRDLFIGVPSVMLYGVANILGLF